MEPFSFTLLTSQCRSAILNKRLRVYLTASLIIALASLSALVYYIYSITPPINRIPVLQKDEALRTSKLYWPYYNASYDFSSAGTEWLVVLQIPPAVVKSSVARLVVFKVGGSDTNDAVVLGVDPKSTESHGYSVDVFTSTVFFGTNATMITMIYGFGEPAVYIVDFGLRVQVYSSAFLLPIAKDVIRVPTNVTVHYGV